MNRTEWIQNTGLLVKVCLTSWEFGIQVMKVLCESRVQLEFLNMNHLDNVSTRGECRHKSAAQNECAHVSHKLLLGSSLSAQVYLE